MAGLTFSHLKNNKKYPSGTFGLEIEMEFATLQENWEFNPKAWKFEKEHSVRNFGVEVVAAKPMTAESLEPMVTELCGVINGRNPIKDCPRTSVHVHINQGREKILHILNSIVAYWLLETPLVRHCGEEREGHHFCLRLKDAEALITVLCESLDQPIPLKDLGDSVRYASLNISALNKYGSLEFRSMRGTTDPVVIVDWAKSLHHLCNVAKTFGSPAQVFDYYLSCTKEDFVRRFLPGKMADIVLATPGYRDMMDESASIVCTLAYAKDWETWEARVLESIKKQNNKSISAIDSLPDWLQPQVTTAYYNQTLMEIDDYA